MSSQRGAPLLRPWPSPAIRWHCGAQSCQPLSPSATPPVACTPGRQGCTLPVPAPKSGLSIRSLPCPGHAQPSLHPEPRRGRGKSPMGRRPPPVLGSKQLRALHMLLAHLPAASSSMAMAISVRVSTAGRLHNTCGRILSQPSPVASGDARAAPQTGSTADSGKSAVPGSSTGQPIASTLQIACRCSPRLSASAPTAC